MTDSQSDFRRINLMDNTSITHSLMFHRRRFLVQVSATIGGTALLSACGTATSAKNTTQAANTSTVTPVVNTGPFTLPPLGYDFTALEPYIDAKTMEVHHDRHHAAYVTNLNTTLKGHPFASLSAEEILRRLNELPENIRTTVRNNAGGHANHSMFWKLMKPGGPKEPKGALANNIKQTFGSLDAFKTAFNDAGTKQFGSGWVWLIQTKEGKLQIKSTPNQDTPLLEGITPILGNDVWEHAYYLKYQNLRAAYLQAWWNVVNWDEVARRYDQLKHT
jgi:Fe-Mn family superoxide dismutase